jgi:transcriptional regulator with XRE-family HTH domain
MVSNTNASRARALGAELREARKHAGMTLEQLAGQLGRSHSDLSRWETGKRIPSEADTAAVLGILGVIGDDRDRLVQLAREAANPNWVAPGVNRGLAALIEDEKVARHIVNVEPLVIPGLLQSDDYANAIMTGAGASRGEIEQRVLVRMGRQRLLTRRNAPEFVAVIGEHALRYPPCTAVEMVDQLQHLLTMSEHKNVTIHVLPFGIGYSPAHEGSFVLLEFAQGAPVVHQEHYRSTTTITESRDVRDYAEAVESILGKTLNPADSAGAIERLAEEMEQEK